MNWTEPLRFFEKYKIPINHIRKLVDTQLSLIQGRPIFDIYVFDDYLHSKYGDYEDKGKSLEDMFNEIFGADVKKAKEYFMIDP